MKRIEFLWRMGLGLSYFFSNQNPFHSLNHSPQKRIQLDLKTHLLNLGDPSIIIEDRVLVFRISTGNFPNSFMATEAVGPHSNQGYYEKSINKKRAYKMQGRLKIYPITINENLMTIFIS